jgi:hypothetical protein
MSYDSRFSNTEAQVTPMLPIETHFNQESGGCAPRDETWPGFFDYFLGLYIIAMVATNFSSYNDLLSTLGLLIPLAFSISLLVRRVKLEREFFALVFFYLWLILGAFLSDFRGLALDSAFYVIKVQAITFIVAFRCSSFRLLRFYVGVMALGTMFLVLPSLFGAIPVGEERLGGVAGQANAMGYIAATGAITWTSLLILGRQKWRWLICPFLALASTRVLFLTGSRGAFVTLAAFLAVVLWYFWYRGQIHTKILVPLAVLLAAVVAGKFLGGEAPLLERMARLLQGLGINMGVSATEEGSMSDRLILINHAIEIFKKYPIVGAGWGTFRKYSFAVYTHTTPFELLYATGIVGTLLYYYIVVSAISTLMKGRMVVRGYFGENRGMEICLALVAAQLAAGLAIPIISAKVFAALPGMWLGITWYIRTLSREQGEEHPDFGGPVGQ